MIKSRGMRWVGHVARMREMRNAYKIYFGNLKGRYHSEEVGVDGRTKIKKDLREEGLLGVGSIHQA
jgi:hypothetical protein